MQYLDSEGREIKEGFYTFAKSRNPLLYITKSKKVPGHWLEYFDWVIHSSRPQITGLTPDNANKLWRIYNIEEHLNHLQEQIKFGHATLEWISQTLLNAHPQ